MHQIFNNSLAKSIFFTYICSKICLFMMQIKTLLATAILACGAMLTAQAQVNEKPFTVPEVAAWKGGKGSFKPLENQSRIVTPKNDAVAERIARQLSQDYTTYGGSTLNIVPAQKAKKGDISLAIKPNAKANPESYSMIITPDGVTITAPTERGLFWATRTLLQLFETSADGSIPAGVINDAPEYAIRGFMIDTGRKFMPMNYLYTLVDAMAYHKMNTLHVHLNDNGFPYYYDDNWDKTQAAFRLESTKFPGLAARDGSYSKDEFRQFIKDAALKGVEIIPEIDFPAHTLAFTLYKPEIASTGRNGRDHLDITKPETYQFLDTLLTEYLGGNNPVFCSPRFHIGTDEYQGDSLTMEQFRGFTDRYIKFTEKFGKQPAIWGSLTHAKGKTPVQVDNVLMYGWSNGYANPRDMLKLGYKMVSIPDGAVYIVPNAGYYYDYLNNKALYDNWTPNMFGFGDKFKFTGDTIKQIEGGMFAVWNDHPTNGITVKDIHHRVMHSLPTMAAKTWNADKVTRPFAEFDSLCQQLSEAPGVNFLARYGNAPTEVLAMATLTPGQEITIPEIGYPYTIEFDIEGAAEVKGTKLFESPNATFWLSDPISGRMAFSREDDLNTFRQNILPGEKLHIKVTGTNKETNLYVNDKLIDNLNVRWLSYNGGKNKIAQVRTLFFPLTKAGQFNSKISNLRVLNY